MAGVNKVILVGRLGQDPELKRIPSGASVVSVASFTMATSKKRTDVNGQVVEHTEWHNVVLWQKVAELACQYLKKGSNVYIEGELRTRSWEENGKKLYRTEIVGQSMQFLDSRPQQPQQHQVQQQYQQPQEPQGLPLDDQLPF